MILVLKLPVQCSGVNGVRASASAILCPSQTSNDPSARDPSGSCPEKLGFGNKKIILFLARHEIIDTHNGMFLPVCWDNQWAELRFPLLFG
jgi:hypothetical protein